MRFRDRKKISLVLSGGGVKAAAFHVGVCLALEQKGFKFIGGTSDQAEQNPYYNDPLAIKSYVGSSAGALICTLLASGHTVEDIIDSFQMGIGFVKRPRRHARLKPLGYFDIFNLNTPKVSSLVDRFFQKKKWEVSVSGGLETILKNNFKIAGLFNSRGIEKYLRKSVLPTNSFHELGAELHIVATYLDHLRKAVFGPFAKTASNADVDYVNYASISDAVAGSVSLPPFFVPYPLKDLEGKDVWFYDGEIRDTMSTHVSTDTGADLVLGSYSIQPYQYTPQVGSLSGFGLPIIINQALYQVVQQKIVQFVKGRDDVSNLISTVSGYFKEAGLPAEHAEKLVNIMCKRANFRPEVDYIYIHPRADDYEMFFVDHFSLSPTILARIVRIGFKSAIQTLRRYDI